MRVNCWPAKRCVRPVLAPAQACVRAGERRGQFGIRNRGAGDERARRSVSVVAICPRFMPGVAFLSRRFAIGARPALRFWRGGLPSARARRCDSVAAVCPRCASGIASLSRRFALGARPASRLWRGVCPRRAPGVASLARQFALGSRPALRFCRGGLPSVRIRRCDSVAAVCPRFMPGVASLARRFALGARPALRFCRGVCHRFTPAVCRMAPNRTACDILRFCSAGRDRHLCVLAVLVWLSDIAGSLRVCAFLYGDLDGVTGDAGERGYGIRENGVRGYGS